MLSQLEPPQHCLPASRPLQVHCLASIRRQIRSSRASHALSSLRPFALLHQHPTPSETVHQQWQPKLTSPKWSLTRQTTPLPKPVALAHVSSIRPIVLVSRRLHSHPALETATLLLCHRDTSAHSFKQVSMHGAKCAEPRNRSHPKHSPSCSRQQPSTAVIHQQSLVC